MASGLAVLSTDVGGIKEHVDESKGILIKKGNENALLEKMNYMLDNYQRYDQEQLRNYAKSRFSYETVGKSYFEIYQSILND